MDIPPKPQQIKITICNILKQNQHSWLSEHAHIKEIKWLKTYSQFSKTTTRLWSVPYGGWGKKLSTISVKLQIMLLRKIADMVDHNLLGLQPLAMALQFQEETHQIHKTGQLKTMENRQIWITLNEDRGMCRCQTRCKYTFI